MSKQKAKAKRSKYITVHRNIWFGLLLLVGANIVDDLEAGTGWSVLAVFAVAARIVAFAYFLLWLARPREKGITRRD